MSQEMQHLKNHILPYIFYVKGQGLSLHIARKYNYGEAYLNGHISWLINIICLKLGMTTVDLHAYWWYKILVLRAMVMFVHETIRIMKLCHCSAKHTLHVIAVMHTTCNSCNADIVHYLIELYFMYIHDRCLREWVQMHQAVHECLYCN